VRVVERRPMPPLGHFSLIRFARLGRAASDDAAGARGAMTALSLQFSEELASWKGR